MGQFVNSRYAKLNPPEMRRNWIGSGYFNLSINILINQHLSVVGTIEAEYGYNTTPLDMPYNTNAGPPSQNIYLSIPNAKGVLSFSINDNMSAMVHFGRLEYKYNPDSRNLGEYLFRTGTYPAYIRTSFDLPCARVSGALASLNIGDRLRQDLLLTTLTDIRPFNDFTLTYLVDASIHKSLSFGGAVQFASLISPMPDQTSLPKILNNFYQNAVDDTSYYTFRGTKLMGRISFDPKPFLNASFFGSEDLKLYAEAAVLGLKSYPRSDQYYDLNLDTLSDGIVNGPNKSNPFGYDTLWQKIPVTLGVNIPVFKLLDVVAFEAEWYGCRYPNSYQKVVLDGPAVPDDPSSDPTSEYTRKAYAKDDWKWSVYVKKTFYERFSLIFQAARDHTRLRNSIYTDFEYQETFVLPRHWYWMGKLKFNF